MDGKFKFKSQMTITFSTVAVVGATGNIGQSIAKAILSDKTFKFKILTRSDTLEKKSDLLKEFKSHGAEIVTVDFQNTDSIAAALNGVQVLVSATSGYALQEQFPLIEAAKKAGVSRFYPSEYGIDDASFPLVVDCFKTRS